MEIVELLVRIDCKGCERKIRKHLSKLKGVDNVDVDLRMNKVTVVGYVDRRRVLKAVRKTGKRAEFWPHGLDAQFGYASYNDTSSPYNKYSTSYHNNTTNYALQHHAFKSTYNYEKHGYNNYDFLQEGHGYYYSGTSHADKSPTIFSDENPHACTIM